MAEDNNDLNLKQIREEIHKEAKSQAAKGLVLGVIALVSIALTGWWLYLKPKLVEVTGGVPQGAVMAFDLPGGCPKKGWEEFNDASGKFIIGVSSAYKYRVAGGRESYALSANNLPPINITLSTGNNARLVDATRFDGGSGNSPTVNNSGKRHPYASNVQVKGGNTGRQNNYNVMPPYIPLHLCKKT